MRTELLGRVQIDEEKLAGELQLSTTFPYSTAYSDYLCGGPWKSCMLWATGGDAGDGLITHYDHNQRSSPTRYGEQMPYLSRIVEETFDLSRLNFARLATIANSVVIPHRDLLELDELPAGQRNTHRFHLPLATNDQCFFAEVDTVFQMAVGEVWALDASREHSAASFSTDSRVHLILDFADVDDPRHLVNRPLPVPVGIPQFNVVERPPLEHSERERLLGLSRILDHDNFRDVFNIVIRVHYRRDGGPGFVWDTLLEIGRRSGDPAIAAFVEDLHRHFLIRRTA